MTELRGNKKTKKLPFLAGLALNRYEQDLGVFLR